MVQVQGRTLELRDRWSNWGASASERPRQRPAGAIRRQRTIHEDRRIARRVLANFTASPRSVRDPQYRELLDAIRAQAAGR